MIIVFKSAGVPSDGALYRVQAEKVNGVDLLTAADPGAPTGENWYNLSLIWPETDAGWQPLRALLEDPSLLDREAFADYYLYVNLIGAADNMTKNLFLCWDGQRFYPMPWDLDAAIGRLYTGAPSDPEAWYSAPLFDRLLADASFQALLRERWTLWRDLLAPEAVMARFEALYRRIDGCGAWAREAERFPVYTDSVTGVSYPLDPAGELDFIRAFLTRRFALLDAAYGGSL